jgi:hypothetical protein
MAIYWTYCICRGMYCRLWGAVCLRTLSEMPKCDWTIRDRFSTAEDHLACVLLFHFEVITAVLMRSPSGIWRCVDCCPHISVSSIFWVVQDLDYPEDADKNVLQNRWHVYSNLHDVILWFRGLYHKLVILIKKCGTNVSKVCINWTM